MTSSASSCASLSERNRAVPPEDAEQFKALIAERDATIQTLTAALESLKQQFLALRRAQFGASSERIEGQAELFCETVSLPVPPVQSETITYDRERRGRPALPKNLPRVRIEYDLTEVEKNDFETLTRIGEDKSETLDYIPARLQVIEHVRAKYVATRKADGGQTVVSASMPPAPLPKSNASANLLSHVLVSKYADHLPLNRIEGIFGRHGVDLARSTLCDWVLGSTELLSVIYQAMKTHVLAAPKIHADDTILPLCEQGRGRLVQARLWAYLGAGATRLNEQSEWIEHPAAVFYEFTDDRRGEHVQRMLTAYRGYLQADAYAGFDALYKDGRILEVGCWAHYLEYRFMSSSGPSAPSLTSLWSSQRTPHNHRHCVDVRRRVGEWLCRFRCARNRVLRRISLATSGVMPACSRALCIRRAAARSPVMAPMRA